MRIPMTPPDPSPSPPFGNGSDGAVGRAIDTIEAVLKWLIAHPAALIAIIGFVAAIVGWQELKKQMMMRGKTIPPIGPTITKYVTFIREEDTGPYVSNPEWLAARMAPITGRRSVLLGILATGALIIIGQLIPAAIVAAITLIPAKKRADQVFTYRHSYVMTMFQVANGEFRYGRGSELNAEAFIQVLRWNDVYYPAEVSIHVPGAYHSEDPRNRERFEINFTGSVTDQHGWQYTWESAKGRVLVEPTPKLPTSAAYPGVRPGQPWNKFPVGITYGEKPAEWVVDTCPHLLVMGPTGTGKSVTQRNILLHALSSPMWRVMALDPKKVEMNMLRDPSAPNGLKPQVLRVSTTLEEMTAALEFAEQEMNSRYTRMESLGVNHFLNLPEPEPALLIMVDEVYALLAPENIKSDEGKERDALHARCTTLIGSIARLGRAAGIHLALATQRPDAKVIPGETRNNIDARIACGRMDTTPSLMALDSDHATRLVPIKGRGIMRLGGEYHEFQGYFCPPDQFDRFLESGRAIIASGSSTTTGGGRIPRRADLFED